MCVLLLTTSILISTPAWRCYLGSLWALLENSSHLTQERPICACVPPKKKPSLAIITPFPSQRYCRHATRKNRLQEIGLILIWPNYQERKWANELSCGAVGVWWWQRGGIFFPPPEIDCVLKGEMLHFEAPAAQIIGRWAYWLFESSIWRHASNHWPAIFTLTGCSELVSSSLIQVQIHLEIWVITVIALRLPLPRWQLRVVDVGCKFVSIQLKDEREKSLRFYFFFSVLLVFDNEKKKKSFGLVGDSIRP